MASHPAYRPEIDGLRMVAVVAVIIFHLNEHWLKGGFLGVDVFFVISGFLITGILYRQMREGRFSLIDFWKRRIRRLYPALLVVVGVTFAVGSLVMVRPERDALPWQAVASLFSWQNFQLWWTTGGYWSEDSENLFFLHTWSLSVEEQFYLVFSLLLLLLCRYARGREQRGLWLLLLSSLVLCVVGTPFYRNAAFYLLPTRFWELLLGGALAVHRVRHPDRRFFPRAAPWLQAAGLALIIGSFLKIENNAHFPGILPLFPCLGTLLILEAGSAPGLVHRFLASAPAVYVGKLSYSLYLWHWPVIVFFRSVSLEPHPVATVGITAVLSVLTYHFVECPFRYGIRRRRAVVWLGSGITACLVPFCLFPSSPFLRNLGDIDAPESYQRGFQFEAKTLIREGKPGLVLPASHQHPDLCVLGSSHARVLCPPIAEYARTTDHTLLVLTTSGVGLAGPSGGHDPDVSLLNERRLATIAREDPTVVIIAGIWAWETEAEDFDERFAETLRLVSAHAKHVIVMGEVPVIDLPKRYKNSLRKYLVAASFMDRNLVVREASDIPEINRHVEEIVASIPAGNLSFVDPHDLLITPDGGVRIVENGKFLYSDRHHLNATGASLVFDHLLKERLKTLLGEP